MSNRMISPLVLVLFAALLANCGSVATESECAIDADCPSGVCFLEHCVECGSHEDCLADQVCVNTICENKQPEGCEGDATCSDHGVCADSSGVIVCTCDAGHAGDRCERCDVLYTDYGDDSCRPADPCSDDTDCASQFRQCENNQGTAECGDCLPGYSEDNALCIEDQSCLPNTCSRHGSCDDSGGAPVCTCDPEYAGEHCEICADGFINWPEDAETCVDDLCLPDPCDIQNGVAGSCEQSDAVAFLCACDAGHIWDGSDCIPGTGCTDMDSDGCGDALACPCADCNDNDDQIYEDAPELCDRKDNDCDGLTDEDFKDVNGEYSLQQHCGGCNQSCDDAIQYATAICDLDQGVFRCMVDSCSLGYHQVGPVTCIPTSDNRCQPCLSNDDCPIPGDACLLLDGGSFCGYDCSDGNLHGQPPGTCPSGDFLCADLGADGMQCLPLSGSCACLQSDLADTRICVQSNQHGTCTGLESCDPTTGWVECSAAMPDIEICNGVDDDCDGLTDDDVMGLGDECIQDNIHGQCFGTMACVNPSPNPQCTAPIPAPEICNYLDDDCDGQTDEDFPEVLLSCSLGIGVCERWGFFECSADGSDAVCNAVPGMPDLEICNYLDDNCDGDIDEGFSSGNGQYDQDTACGNCYTDCTLIFDLPNAHGTCVAFASPTCIMNCDPGWLDLNAIPMDGCEFQINDTAVYVSVPANGGADTISCGDWDMPCASIGWGLARATAEPSRTRVLVSDGAYEEEISLIAGIDLLGGFQPDTWERHIDSTNTILIAPLGDGHRKAVSANDIHTSTTFEGFVIHAAPATTAGSNSYGIYVSDSDDSLEIRSNRILAGSGAAGIWGAGGSAGVEGQNGGNGLDTFNTNCSSAGFPFPPSIGPGGSKNCQNPASPSTFTLTTGGNGGAPVCPDINIQSGGGVNGFNGGGDGGAGGWGHNSYTTGGCQPTAGVLATGEAGAPGAPSSDGSGGSGCMTATGQIIGGEWQGLTASDGDHGLQGRGGGGGGSGGGQQLDDGNWRDISGGGGGGGSGGCAGERGAAGHSAGGSFGVFVVFSSTPSSPADLLWLADNTITRDMGGRGGNGGSGGPGGDGGLGGFGGEIGDYDGPIYCIFGGANGGAGSRGGHAGGGGGGCGGPSFDIAIFGLNGVNSAGQVIGNTYTQDEALPTGGTEGTGGGSMNTTTGLGENGLAGLSGNLLIVD